MFQTPLTPAATPPKGQNVWKGKGKGKETEKEPEPEGEGTRSTHTSSPDESDQERTPSPDRISLSNVFQRFKYPIIVYTPRSTPSYSERESSTPTPTSTSIRYPSLSRARERLFQDEGHNHPAVPTAGRTQSLHQQPDTHDQRGGDDGRASIPESPSPAPASTFKPLTLLFLGAAGVLAVLFGLHALGLLALQAIASSRWQQSYPTTTPVCSSNNSANPFAHMFRLPTVDFATHPLMEHALTVTPAHPSHVPPSSSSSSSASPSSPSSSRQTDFSSINKSLSSLIKYTDTLSNLSSLPYSHSAVQDALQGSHHLTETLTFSSILPSLLAGHQNLSKEYSSRLALATSRAAAAELSSKKELAIRLFGVERLGINPWLLERDQVRQELAEVQRAHAGLEEGRRRVEELVGRLRCFHGKIAELGGGVSGGRSSIRRLGQGVVTRGEGGGWWIEIVRECGAGVLEQESLK